MKHKNLSVRMAAGAAALVVCATNPAFTEVTFDWATVGNPGNAEDPLNSGDIPGIGSVAEEYRIAKHEVTNEQYAEFLNAVAGTDTNNLYSVFMGSNPRGGIMQGGSSGGFTYAAKTNMANKPVNYVSFLDAMRFVNWLHNGQPSGAQDASTTEDGVYTISDGLSETRADDAQFFIPSENEWYKAAYHQRASEDGDGDNYWLYANATNSEPNIAMATATGDISNPGPSVANYESGADWNFLNGNVTTVGSAGVVSPDGESFYGTSDQGGNVMEWNEKLVEGAFRCLRGGSWGNIVNVLRSSVRREFDPMVEGMIIGFRVANPVPLCSADLDGDGDVDLQDFAISQSQFTGPK